MVKNLQYLIIVVIFAFIAGFSLLKSGLPPTHDGEYHIIRFYEFDKVLKDGSLYPRWAPDLNNGYGVPLFNYVYPLPNYIASFLHIFSISFIDAFKYSMFIASIIGAIFFYLWSKDFWGNLGGMVSSVFYTFAPYHFVDIYVRGSIGEVWALAFFPAFLWAITKLLKEKKQIFLPVASIFLSLVIFSHNILGLMFFIFSFCYGLFLILQLKAKKESLIIFFLTLLLSLGLSSIFWLPALMEQEYVKGLKIYTAIDNFPEAYQLIFPSWGTGFSEGKLQNQMSFQIGIANLLVTFMSLFIGIRLFYKKDNNKYFILFFLVWFFIIFFLMLKSSSSIWKIVPFLNYFQFPWRFLSLEIVIASFLAGSIFSVCKSKIIALFFIFFAVVLSIGYTKPAYYHERSDNYYFSRSNFIDGTNSPGNLFNTVWIDNVPEKRKNKFNIVRGEGKIKSEKKHNNMFYSANLFLVKDSLMETNIAYFPGWIAFIDGQEFIPQVNKNGIITLNIPKGEHIVEIKFLDTKIRKIGTYGSLLSVFVLLFFFKISYARIKR